MDIKESFYDKLEQIREEKEKPSLKKIKKTQNDNDSVFKNWRKDMPDKETTKKLVGEENLDEMQRKSKEAMDAIMDRVSKKHDEKWEKTKEKRTKEKLKGSEKTKEEDKERNNLGKRWKRAYLAKKKLKK